MPQRKKPLELRLYDFEVGEKGRGEAATFIVTAFGMDADGAVHAVHINNIQPTVLIRTEFVWTEDRLEAFQEELTEALGRVWWSSVQTFQLVKAGFLYGYDRKKQHQYVRIEFANMRGLYGIRGLFFQPGRGNTKVLEDYVFELPCPSGPEYGSGALTETLKLCESSIPPLLRAFHTRNIQPAGWVRIEPSVSAPPAPSVISGYPATRCKSHVVRLRSITALPAKEDPVPFKIASWDIEASSSHGDFPLAGKDYAKAADDLVRAYDAAPPDESDIPAWMADRLAASLTWWRACDMPLYADAEGAEPPPGSEHLVNAFDCIDVDAPSVPAFIDENAIRTALTRHNTKPRRWKPPAVKKARPRYAAGDDGDDAPQVLVKQRVLHDILEDDELADGDRIALLTSVLNMCAVSGALPGLKGDEVTFIGTSFKTLVTGDMKKVCICVGEAAPIAGVEVINVPTERDAILAWRTLIVRENPQFLVGYNTFGFDHSFMLQRANYHGCGEKYLDISLFAKHTCGQKCKEDASRYSITQQTLSIASGTHELSYITMPGRVEIDLYNHFRKEVSLESYKLDDVVGHFIGDAMKGIELVVDGKLRCTSRNLHGLEVGNYVVLEELGYAPEALLGGAKLEVLSIDVPGGSFVVAGGADILEGATSQKGHKVRWCLAKDDVGPQDIFRLTSDGSPEALATVAKYCVADTTIVHHLLSKTDVITGYTEMANICSVPLSFIVTRGQGIKLQSYLAKKCAEENIVMPDLDKRRTNEAYEGAVVLEPTCRLFQNEPVAVVDFSSLYPSCAISENISHDTKAWYKQYNLSGELVKDTTPANFVKLPDHEYVEIAFDTYAWRHVAGSKVEKKVKTGRRTCCWVQFPNGEKGVIPSVLKELLAARKATRKLIKHKTITLASGESHSGLLSKNEDGTVTVTGRSGERNVVGADDIVSTEDTYDDFMKNVFDKRQLGYKITANSVYGQTGAKIGSFYEPDIAASITAEGRRLLTTSRDMVVAHYNDIVCNVLGADYKVRAECVYGDTDSLFLSFNLRHAASGEQVVGREARAVSIELGKQAGQLVTKTLKAPHDLEYEKTFDPYIQFAQKRYAGMLYEDDPDAVPKLKSMGIVLKRRDNAPIVKDLYGGVLAILMNNEPVKSAVQFVKTELDQLIGGGVPMSRLIITKSLRSTYKNPSHHAHKVLADRIAQRDPGNAPRPGDRIGFVYVVTKTKTKLQGDRVESPAYALAHKLDLDYSFYLTNQIVKPLQQIFALVLDQIPRYARVRAKHITDQCKLQALEITDEKLARREETLRAKYAKDLVFGEALRKFTNKTSKQFDMHAFF